MAGHNGPKLTTKNLILNLDMLRNTSWNIGRSEWYDLSQFKNDAQLINSPTISNVVGDISFESGQDEYATINGLFSLVDGPNAGFNTDDFTIEIWIYPESFGTTLHILSISDDSEFALKASSTTGDVYFESSSFTTISTITSWSLTLNQWNCIAFKRESSTAYAYLNGALVGTQSSFNNSFTSDTVNIRKGEPGEYSPAKYRTVRIYNSALTDHEIRSNYEAFKQRKYIPLDANTLSATSQTPIISPTIGRSFSAIPVEGFGGNGEYFYKFSDSTPAPSGVTVDNLTGEVSGIVDSLLTDTYTIEVSDALGQTASAVFNLIVQAEPLITTINTPNFEIPINTSVTNTPVAGSGGFGTLSYSISPSLPQNTEPAETFGYEVTANGDLEYNFVGPRSGANINISIIQGTTIEFNVNAEGVDAVGQENYTTPGNFSFVVPTGVTSLNALCIGGGGGGGGSNGVSGPGSSGGGGGGLGWGNEIAVTPGETLSITVGAGGNAGTSSANGQAGGTSTISRGGTVLLSAGGGGGGISNTTNGAGGTGGTRSGTELDGGGTGGQGGQAQNNGAGAGGGGAAGYAGNGGKGAGTDGGSTAGQGGGAGGGANINSQRANQFSGGAGVGPLGQGASGSAGTTGSIAGAGSGGGTATTTRGGIYGGGGGGTEDDTNASGTAGGQGYVRLIWGPGRSYPSTNTQDVTDGGATPQNFWIKTAQVDGTGSAVTQGVTNNGTANGTVIWDTSGVTPGVYYYISENSSNMTGIILINPIPPSLSFNTSTGEITGTPIQPYSPTEHTVTITDQLSPTAQEESAVFGLSVLIQVLEVNIIEPGLVLPVNEVVDVRPIIGSGGFGSYFYSISAALPSGLSFNTFTGAITGTPDTVTGIVQYTVTVEDITGNTASGNFTIEIAEPSASSNDPTDFLLEATETGGTPGVFTATDANGNLNLATDFDFPGYYKITIPSNGNYEITVRGCNGTFQGINNSSPENFAAEIIATVPLSAGDELICLAGQTGIGTTSDGEGGGGGGGSFVAIGTSVASAQPLVVAGGGGGSCFNRQGQDNARGYANTGEIGRAGLTSGYSPEGHGWTVGGGGLASNGGGRNIAAWNGGGFFTSGSGASARGGGTHGQAFILGGLGGVNQSGVNSAGFGGGGGGANNCGYGGGAGGYSGGGSGGYTAGCGGHGGGGGSYTDPSATNVSSSNIDNRFGYIKIVSL